MTEIKFNINNIDNLMSELTTANDLLDALNDVVDRILAPADGSKFEKLTDSQINMMAYELCRDSNQLTSLINVAQEKISKAIKMSEEEITNYYADMRTKDGEK